MAFGVGADSHGAKLVADEARSFEADALLSEQYGPGRRELQTNRHQHRD
jgi:hypothetical protein